MLAAHQHTGAVRPADDEFGVVLTGLVEQPLQRLVMVEQRITAGEQETIGLGFFQVQGQFARLDAVDAKAPRP